MVTMVKGSSSMSASASAVAAHEPLDHRYDYQQHHPGYRDAKDATRTKTTHVVYVNAQQHDEYRERS
jgi:hypothetical protein